MNEEEDLIETIMRASGYGNYNNYNSEEIREKWRKFLRSDSNDSMVQEQPRHQETDS